MKCRGTFSDEFIMLLIAIGAFLLIISLCVHTQNTISKANCNLLRKNGHVTHIETIPLMGVSFKDCYIQLEDGNSVPYDKFRGTK